MDASERQQQLDEEMAATKGREDGVWGQASKDSDKAVAIAVAESPALSRKNEHTQLMLLVGALVLTVLYFLNKDPVKDSNLFFLAGMAWTAFCALANPNPLKK